MEKLSNVLYISGISDEKDRLFSQVKVWEKEGQKPFIKRKISSAQTLLALL